MGFAINALLNSSSRSSVSCRHWPFRRPARWAGGRGIEAAQFERLVTSVLVQTSDLASERCPFLLRPEQDDGDAEEKDCQRSEGHRGRVVQ